MNRRKPPKTGRTCQNRWPAVLGRLCIGWFDGLATLGWFTVLFAAASVCCGSVGRRVLAGSLRLLFPGRGKIFSCSFKIRFVGWEIIFGSFKIRDKGVYQVRAVGKNDVGKIFQAVLK